MRSSVPAKTIGYPECAINLAHGVAYLAYAKKTKSAYEALRAAQADVKEYGNLPIPKKIRNAPTKLMKDLEYGKGYERYDTESYMPDKLKNESISTKSQKNKKRPRKRGLFLEQILLNRVLERLRSAELRRASSSDLDGLASARVAAGASRASLCLEDAEACDGNFVAGLEAVNDAK
jgi:replication-associated recombination protein RarA